jgi:hypothetical protein
MNDRRALRKSQSLIIKKRIGLDPDLLNFISADGIVRFRSHYPINMVKVSDKLYFKEYWKRVALFHIDSEFIQVFV